ncbi:MAG: ABC transporter permease [Brevundimonas sp.]
MTALTLEAGPVTRERATKERLFGAVQDYGAMVVLGMLVVLGAAAFPSFLTADNLTNIATQSSFTLIIAVGMTFTILTGGIDLSVGSMFALGGVLAAMSSHWGGLAAALLVPVLAGVVVGAVQGSLIAWGRMAPFIVTLAGLGAVRGVSLALTQGGSITPLVQSDAFRTLGQGGIGGLRFPVFVAIAVLVVGIVVLGRTRTGMAVYAVGGSESAALLMGLPARRVKFVVYVISGAAAGLAGALSAAYSSSGVPNVGVGYELTVIATVVIGGTLLTGGKGSLVGTLAGVLVLAVIQNLINQVGSLTSSVQLVVSGGFLAIVVVAQTLLARQQRI